MSQLPESFFLNGRMVLGDNKKCLSKTKTLSNIYTKIESMYSLEVNGKEV